MRGDERKEPSGKILPTPHLPIPEILVRRRSFSEDLGEVALNLDPLSPNGVIGSDASGLDREFYEEIRNEGE